MSDVITAYYANVFGTPNRAPGSPAGLIPYSQALPSNIKRLHLFIQNKGGTDVQLSLASNGSPIALYAGASISLDNYNGGFTLNTYDGVSVLEAFAS